MSLSSLESVGPVLSAEAESALSVEALGVLSQFAVCEFDLCVS
jgi:hypothetical protein